MGYMEHLLPIMVHCNGGKNIFCHIFFFTYLFVKKSTIVFNFQCTYYVKKIDIILVNWCYKWNEQIPSFFIP